MHFPARHPSLPWCWHPSRCTCHSHHATHPSSGPSCTHTLHPLQTRTYNNRGYVLEEAITGDFALVKGYKADTRGNVVFKGTAR